MQSTSEVKIYLFAVKLDIPRICPKSVEVTLFWCKLGRLEILNMIQNLLL